MSAKVAFVFDKSYPCGQYANGDWWVSTDAGGSVHIKYGSVRGHQVTDVPTATGYSACQFDDLEGSVDSFHDVG